MFTNALKSYVQSALTDLQLPDDCVLTFDAWCRDFYQTRVATKIPWNRGPDFAAIRQGVLAVLQAGEVPGPLYDFVLVDEGQDLDESAYRILDAIATHVTVFMDHKQQVYEHRVDEAMVLRTLHLRRRNLSLLDAYRCSPYIVRAAAAFIPDQQERDAFVHQNTPTQHGRRQTPVLYLAKDHADLRDDLYGVIRSCLADNDRVAILLPTRRQVFGYAKGLVEAGLDVEVPAQPGRRKTTMPVHDFSGTKPKVMAYPSAKGLTFDSVLMPALRPSDLPKDATLADKWLFVGITRATRWAYFSAVDGQCHSVARFDELERQGQLTVRRRAAGPNDSHQLSTMKTDLSDLF